MDEPVKVLAIAAQLNRGGIESRLMDILRETDVSRVRIDIFTYRLTPGAYDEEAKRLGAHVFYNEPLTVKNMFWYVKYFADFLKKHPEYKIVHAYQDAWCSVFCKGAYLAGVPVRIAHSRTAIAAFSVKNMCKNIIKLPTRKYATHYFAVSDKAGRWLFGNRLCESGKVEIWKNAIDCQAYRYSPKTRKAQREALGIGENQFVIMHVGNFTAPKNHVFLIEIFEKLSPKCADAVLVLVGGDTPAEQNMSRIKRVVKEKGLEKQVHFLGSRSNVNELLQAADVFVFPSVFEGFPGAVLEAQAAGLPCVVSDAVTREVKLLETTRMLPLTEGAEKWSTAVMDFRGYVRKDTYEEIVKQGFDIHLLVEQLMKFYEGEALKNGVV